MTVEIVRALILIAVFAAVFLFSQYWIANVSEKRRHKGAVNTRLRMIAEGENREEVMGKLLKNRPKSYDELPSMIAGQAENFQRLVFMSGVKPTAGQILMFMGLGFALVFFLALVMISLIGGSISIGSVLIAFLFALSLAIVLPYLIIKQMAMSRRKKIEHQFPVALDIFVRALKSGHPVAAAIDLLTREMDDPIGSEFGIISDEISFGADLIGSLDQMAMRWDLEDMQMFVVSLSVQSQTGGNLAEILENISKVIRDRHQMFMKVKALSSEGRMTGWMLTVLPVFTFVSVFLSSPQYYINTSDDPIFIRSAIGLVLMYALGVYIIRRLIDLKV